jgi:Leucine-rich repeat (LRR) protein
MKEYIKMLLRESLTDDELLKEIFRQLKETDGKKLDLISKGITSLPESIGNHTKLLSLSLASNYLIRLPESIGALTNLRKLFLGRNKLQSLPESIGYLTELKSLNLEHNKLESLPDSIANLTNLEELVLTGNPISDEEMKRIKYELLPNTKFRFIKKEF